MADGGQSLRDILLGLLHLHAVGHLKGEGYKSTVPFPRLGLGKGERNLTGGEGLHGQEVGSGLNVEMLADIAHNDILNFGKRRRYLGGRKVEGIGIGGNGLFVEFFKGRDVVGADAGIGGLLREEGSVPMSCDGGLTPVDGNIEVCLLHGEVGVWLVGVYGNVRLC